MKTNIMDKYIMGIVVAISLIVYYMYGLNDVLFLVTITIFTFSLTRDLKMIAPFILISTYIYINYLDSGVEGFKSFKKLTRKAKNKINIVKDVATTGTTSGTSVNSTSSTPLILTDTATVPNVVSAAVMPTIRGMGLSSSNGSELSKIIKRDGDTPYTDVERAIVGSVSQSRGRNIRDNNEVYPDDVDDPDGLDDPDNSSRRNRNQSMIISEFNKINKSNVKPVLKTNPGKLRGSDQIISAYQNLENFLGTEAMKNMSSDSKKLAQKQKALMDQMNALAPVVNNYTQMMNGFDSSKLTDIIGGLNNIMASTKVPT